MGTASTGGSECAVVIACFFHETRPRGLKLHYLKAEGCYND